MRRGNCFIAVGTTFYERRLQFHKKKKKKKKTKKKRKKREKEKKRQKQRQTRKKILKNTKKESY